jgi:hypothetical protein
MTFGTESDRERSLRLAEPIPLYRLVVNQTRKVLVGSTFLLIRWSRARFHLDLFGGGSSSRIACHHETESLEAYLAGREPLMRMSTSLLALCCQSGLVLTLATPISARSKSIGSRSLRMSPLFIARFTSERIASQTRA